VVAMMDVVLGGAMGLVLAVLLTNPPRPKVRAVTAKVVEETPAEAVDPKAAKAAKKKK
jgi:hypothetical protein